MMNRNEVPAGENAAAAKTQRARGARRLFSLDGRVALVTGASSGIGRAIAMTLADAGARVVLVARRESELEATRDAITTRGGEADLLPCDLGDRAALTACAEAAPRAFGPPDIVVNCAGINIRKPMLELTADDWDRTIRLNLDAPFFLSQRLVPAMLERGWGRIINIASLQSVRAFANSGAYGASKGGLMQLTRAQAEAWSGRGVNANAIAPGFFATPLTAAVASDPARWQANAARTFIGRNGELDDLAGTALYLATRASDYVTGQTIFVDGGFSAG
ncbi:MAG TPA: SDR family oxidoreductase [Casimicrobiaceae bacterium]|nr:SDR family oxidoreductase [Casimicrobiaceae bacterium]